jgi:putative transposase
VRNKAVYLALGMNTEGIKEVLGLWIDQTEGAKFWLRVTTELNNWGAQDILIAVVDGLKNFPEAIPAYSPGPGTDLNCAYGVPQPAIRALEGPW